MTTLPPGNFELAARSPGGRCEEYITPDGKRTQSRSAAVYAQDHAIEGLWSGQTALIPAGYAIATSAHEGAINEVDTEPHGRDPRVTYGCFQISDSERQKVGMPDANLLDLYDSVAVFSRLAELNYHAIEAGMSKLGQQMKFPDAWAYLAYAHNRGVGGITPIDGHYRGALGTIARYGMDWSAFKKRNANDPNEASIIRYGDDVITGKGRGSDPGRFL